VNLLLALALLFQATPAARPSVVTGQLTLRDGSPAGAVRVAAIVAPQPGIRPADGQNYYASLAPVSVALTDNAGRYQLTNVPPGRYYIVAGIVGHATFYPGTSDIDASTIVTLTSGETLDGTDFRMETDAGRRVSGRVTPGPVPGVQERAVLSGITVGDLLDVPVRDDGGFDFGRLPSGEYFLSLIPHAPGTTMLPFRVDDRDVPPLEFTRPPTRAVTGRIVVQRGPLPNALLGFFTPRDYVTGEIKDDLTFIARLHDARYQVDLGGMPVGYSVTSVRIGDADVSTSGFDVGDAATSGIVITVATPAALPRITGRVALTGRAAARVTATGPVVGSLEAPVRADGSFEFPAVPPGIYRLTVPQMPDVAPVDVVVDYATGAADVRLGPAGR
jgi:hypothetical protein